MISNYFHDLAVALLATNILAVYFIGRYLDAHPQGYEIIRNLFVVLSRVTYFAFAYILVAGAVRAYFFREFEWNPAVGRGQIAALVVKHVVLVSITILGIVVHRKYQRLYGIQR
jgi:hypothetical protein